MTTTGSGRAVVTLSGDTEILITREFAAPRHLVYRAWTTPELVKRWWAGQRGEVKSVEIDLRVGGTWRYVMVAHGGFEVAFHGEYREIVPDERIVSTEVFEGVPNASDDDAAVNTLTLTETDGRTTLRVVVRHTCQAHRDAHLNSGMEGGLNEALDLLEKLASELAA
jgi:uncharacterized protein YndB with AHSA1/START domain